MLLIVHTGGKKPSPLTVPARVQAEQGLNMSARFKDSKIAKLEAAMRAGHVDNPADVICDTIESLKGSLLKHENKEVALKVRARRVRGCHALCASA